MSATKAPAIPMTKSGFCSFPSANSHQYCINATCQCSCHGDRPPAPLRANQIIRTANGEATYLSTTANGKHLIEFTATGDRAFILDSEVTR